MERKMPDEFLEKLMLKGMLVDDYYVASLSTTFDHKYFDDEWNGKIYKFITDHFKKYNKIPPVDVVIGSFEENTDKVKEVFNEVESIDYDIAGNFDFLFDETNLYLKEQALKDAITKGVDLVERKKNPLEYKEIVEEALSKDLQIDLGTDYWGNLNERLKRILSQTDVRVPSFYPILDEYISGGFPVYTLSVFMSRIHGFKCVGKDTKIKIRKKSTGEVFYTRIEDIWTSFINENNKEDEMLTLEKMKEKYGEEEGESRYNKWKENISKSSKGRNTINFFIKKYGEEEGKRRHSLYIQKQKQSHSEAGYIKKYGKEEGRKKWQERMDQLKHTTSLEGFISRHGEEEGYKKWKERT